MTAPSEQSYRTIPLTQGQVALVDAEDYERLSAHKWCAAWRPSTRSFYAQSRLHLESGKWITLHMSREVMGLSLGDPRNVDHRDHNTLDNRRSNLRIATAQQNNFNRDKVRDSTSGFKGVHWRNDRNKWRAEIRFGGKLIYLGLFELREDAAEAYTAAAKRLQGEFAYVV